MIFSIKVIIYNIPDLGNTAVFVKGTWLTFSDEYNIIILIITDGCKRLLLAGADYSYDFWGFSSAEFSNFVYSFGIYLLQMIHLNTQSNRPKGNDKKVLQN